MLENWKNWCRFCAKIDISSEDGAQKMQSITNQLEVICKYLMISLLPFEGVESSICGECSSFITKANDFRNRYQKADEMFKELISRKNITQHDLESIRFKYGVDNEDVKHCPALTDTENHSVEQEQSPDPLEVQIEAPVIIKQEKSEEVLPAPRKRGRPKKFTESLSMKKAKIKKEKEDNEMNELKMTEITDHEMTNTEPNIQSQMKDSPSKKRKRIWKGPREKKHFCIECPKKFNRPHLLKEHILEEHRQEEMAHMCSVCSKRFSCAKKLKIHEISHLPVTEGLIYSCPHCDKKFNHKYKIPSHIRAMHTDDKPFVCEECGNSFKTRGALNAHQISHTEERTFQCSNCPKKFKNQRALKRHDEDTHQDTTHECPHCDLKLKNRRTFRSHLLVHSDIKKYKCNYCGSEFKRRKTFKDHLILHSGQRPYECPFCDKTFANGSNCLSHKRKAHPVELAALAASGEPTKITILPKLEHLQPK
ncbi:zinc finger protein 184-like isoform X1 [Phlebotomus papatasi]|uniref:zinc finger protein 184-like isoform X1 n=1 Tax=Phlebotomus papatasi TaxID=29031 RepID=UPI0024835240|nr:zinc finger protein 184-like isoform X1 [Phlebotomus papatasi]